MNKYPFLRDLAREKRRQLVERNREKFELFSRVLGSSFVGSFNETYKKEEKNNQSRSLHSERSTKRRKRAGKRRKKGGLFPFLVLLPPAIAAGKAATLGAEASSLFVMCMS